MPLVPNHYDFDCVVLGCTHFPVFAELIQNMLDNHITLVDSAKSTAIAVQQLLANLDLANNSKKSNNTQTSYLVTDSPERFRRIGRIFLDEAIPDGMVALVDNPISSTTALDQIYDV